MWTKHLFVLIHIRNNYSKASSKNILITFPRRCLFCGSFKLSVLLSCLFIAALWSPAGKWLTSSLSCMRCFLVFLSLSHVVSWVRFGTWFYRFLIFTFFLTWSQKLRSNSHKTSNMNCYANSFHIIGGGYTYLT